MLKLGSWFSKLLILLCIAIALFISSPATNSQEKRPKSTHSEIITTVQSKQDLARAVLLETGIAKQYDLYLDNCFDIAFLNPSDTRLRAWLRGISTQAAGWNHVEEQYIAQLVTHFSQAELKQLLNLAKQPLMKKLLQAEIQAYIDSSVARRKLLAKVWEDYQVGAITPPTEVLP
jgi:hypothetical protein